jgi:peptidoglycan/LPS O-acetylase OafA/YrhL
VVYRPDIQGLRGIAVLAVMIFHLGLPLPGGFVGVDVFFVISGFLMTGLVADAVARTGTLSLADFYARRIRRIFPALLAMIALTTALGYVLLLPGDERELAQSGAAAALSFGNVFFYLTTGYFDIPAEAKPLLHTWSLGVEEQFYLLWPAAMLALYALAASAPAKLGIKLSRRAAMLALLLAIVAAGFLVSIYAVLTNPKAAFYLLPARLWELAAGGVLVFLPVPDLAKAIQFSVRDARLLTPSPRRGEGGVRGIRSFSIHWSFIVPILGLALILASLLLLSPQSLFPGWNALPAVLGAALIVNPASASSLVARALAFAPLVFIGRISYSLYLWHWPLIVFARAFKSGADLTPLDTALVAGLALLVATASWAWIEEPFRKPRAPATTIPLGLAAAAAVAGLASLVVAADGFPARISPRVTALASFEGMWDYRCRETPGPFGTDCAVGAPWETAAARGVVWGDSHAEHLLPLLDVAGRKADRALALFGDCPAIYYEGGLKRVVAGYPHYDDACTAQRARYLDLINGASRIDFVLFAARWSAYLADTYREDGEPHSLAHGLALFEEGLDELVAALAPSGAKIVLMGEMPQMGFDPIPCVILQSIARDHINLWRDPRERARCAAATAAIPEKAMLARLAGPNAALKAVAARHPGRVLAFLPTDAMCADGDCITSVRGEFLYRDGNHLRRNLTGEAMEEFADLLGLPELLRRLGRSAPPEVGAPPAQD